MYAAERILYMGTAFIWIYLACAVFMGVLACVIAYKMKKEKSGR